MLWVPPLQRGKTMTDNPSPQLSLADVLRKGLSPYLNKYGSLPMESFRVLNAIMSCRTESAGAHRTICPQCGHSETAYNSCRNRHCPRCQAHKAKQWAEDRTDELLPLPYFHIVFTIPHELNFIVLQNRECFYNILFRAVSETLLCLAADEKRLGGQIGFFAVLHTWTQTLMDHPHVHVVIPGGGITPDKTQFKRSRPDYIFPVKVMSSLFRGKLLSSFKDAVKQGDIAFHGTLSELQNPVRLQELLDIVYDKDFVVYAKKPFAGPAQVVEYLSRYTHRVAIGDRRILDITDDVVTFKWRDRADNNSSKVMSLDITEFIRRFLMHLLPSGFVKIRYFGFMANAIRKEALILCKKLITAMCEEIISQMIVTDRQKRHRGKLCPCCCKAHLIFDCLVAVMHTG